MFSRAFPRVASRACSRFAHLENHAPVQTFAKLPSRARIPVQHGTRIRAQSTVADGVRRLRRESPVLFPLASLCILIGMGFFLYLPIYYQKFIIAPYHNFPEPVAKKLRKAIFYSSGSYMDLREANKYFRQGLQVAEEIGMDPFSDEILGVKIAISAMFEHANQHNLAIEVLEIMRVDCWKWLELFGDKHWTDGKRTRILSRIVEFDVKLGELYSCKYVAEPDNAEKRLVEAVETILKEKTRRENDGVQPGEGDWMSNEEIGSTMESLGNHYEANNHHYLATPLFLQALSLCPPKSCHGVVLMNNLSICLAQQTPPPSPSSSTSPPSSTPNPPRAMLLDQARQWADKALAKAATISPPDRDEECDIGCATATHNIGEFFEMEGNLPEARQKYEEAASLAKAVGFSEGEVNAKRGLKRLKALERAR